MLPEKDKIKEVFSSKLSGFTPEVPNDVWGKIDKTLSAGQTIIRPRRSLFIRRASLAAGIAASVLLCLMFFYSNNDKIATRISSLIPVDFKRPFIEQPTEFITGLAPDTKESSNPRPLYTQVANKNENGNPDNITAHTNQIDQKKYPLENKKETEYKKETQRISDDKKNVDEAKIKQGIEEFKKLGNEDNTEKTILPTKNNNKGFGLSIGGRSGLAGTNNNPGQSNKLFSLKGSALNDEHIGFEGSIANGKEAYYQKADVNVDHKQPVSFGIAFSKTLNDRLSVETGVIYTYLSSKIKSKNTSDYKSNGSQYFHYIGIPLTVNYTFARWEKADFYISLGGMVQKDVYGRFKGSQTSTDLSNNKEIANVKIEQDNPQFSLMSTVGASYPIYDKLNVYTTVGGSYYFNSKNDYKTIYTDKKVQLDLNVGLKFEF